MSANQDTIQIRDPVHGTIHVSPDELKVVDSPVYQRLRGIKQLGFTEFSFPGATHTRYAHSLGAAQMAGQMFDGIFPVGASPVSEPDRRRLRQVVRLAMLLHDIGHPPLSHASECAMPLRKHLGLSCFTEAEQEQQASHEDYTIHLILNTALGDLIRQRFGGIGVEPEDVCQLITGRFPQRAQSFICGGIDFGPLLNQMISGEMDADRMDYLPRDSYYAGVSYGQFDEDWLLNNLTHHVVDGRAYLALSHRAIFAFEDFLLSRYHMFVSVYYHHTTVAFDNMLIRYYAEAADEVAFPTDPQQYLEFDDIALWGILRRSSNRWARRIVNRNVYRRVLDFGGEHSRFDFAGLQRALKEKNIDYFADEARGVLSRYFRSSVAKNPIFVLNKTMDQVSPIEEYAKVFERYAQPARITRLYCEPDQLKLARSLIRDFPIDPQPSLPL